MKNASLVMAWRNLWRRGRRTWLTVGAMVFSNILLVFSMSLQFGSYEMMIDNSLQAYNGHLQLQHPRYLDEPRMRFALADIADTAGLLRERLGLDSISARAVGFALASSDERSFGLQIVGVDAAHEPLVSTLPGLVRQGRYLQPGGDGEIVIGAALARNLKVEPGDELTFLGSGYDDSFAAGVVRVAGIFSSGVNEIDRGMAQVNLAYFQQTFAMQGRGHAIVVRAPHIEQVESLAANIDALGIVDGDSVALRDWDQLQPGLRQAIQADMTSAWFMYLVLIVLVAFSVLNTQLMSVLERTHEFGVVMSLGMKPGRLGRLVMLETALMGLLGLVLGALVGAAFTAWLGIRGFSMPGMEEMAAQFNLPSRIYMQPTFLSVMIGPTVVFLFTLLASVYPALRLLRLHPVEAMREH